MNDQEFKTFMLAHMARLLDRLRQRTPGASQRARNAVAADMVERAHALAATTYDELDAVMINCIADAVRTGLFQRLASPHRCMCYLNPRVDCWHADKPLTAGHVPSFNWGGV